MLTIKKHKNSKSLKKYFEEHLIQGDYDLENGKIEGKWIGKLVESLGIKDRNSVLKKDFERISDGKEVMTQRSLTQRFKKERIVSYDLVFSAPKSLSILAIPFEDQRLIKAHEKAVESAFLHLEKKAKTRVRKGLFSRNSNQTRETGNLIAAQFTHTTNRNLDPQLHTHCVVFNVTEDSVEKKRKALYAKEIYSSSRYISEIYRNFLAQEVRRLGYEIEEGRHTWRIQGVPLEVEKLFSKRAQEIDQAALELEAARGFKIGNNERALISLQSRKKKTKGMIEKELISIQKDQLSSVSIQLLEQLKQKAISLFPDQNLEKMGASQKIIQWVSDHLFERKSVVSQEEFMRVALKRSSGRCTFEELEKGILEGPLVQKGGDLVTVEEQLRELKLLNWVNSRKKRFNHFRSSFQLSATLSEEQKTAAQDFLNSKDQVYLIRGAAGVGKTKTLREIVRHVSCPVLMTAPTTGATEKLKEEGFKTVLTLQKFLFDLQAQEKLKESLLVIDEAGFLSTQDFEVLFKIADEKNLRILLVGDTRQHGSVRAGDGLRLLETYSRLRRSELTQVKRQKDPLYRKAIEFFSKNDLHSGMKLLEKLNAFHEVSDHKRAKAVAKDYVGKSASGESVLIVTPTWAEQEKVTEAVRTELKKLGALSSHERELTVYRPRSLTVAEKTDLLAFKKGEWISFHLKSGPFQAGEVWEVHACLEEALLLKNSSPSDPRKKEAFKKFTPALHAKAFEVVQKENKHFSKGDFILMRAKARDLSGRWIANGSIHTLESIEPDGTLHLKGGRKISSSFQSFTHGYAVTSFGAQGKDATHVIASAETFSLQSLSSNQAYVSFSRGKKSLSVYTNHLKAFKKAITRSSDRTLVLERLKEKANFIQKLEKHKIKQALDVISRVLRPFFYSSRRRGEERMKEEKAIDLSDQFYK